MKYSLSIVITLLLAESTNRFKIKNRSEPRKLDKKLSGFTLFPQFVRFRIFIQKCMKLSGR